MSKIWFTTDGHPLFAGATAPLGGYPMKLREYISQCFDELCHLDGAAQVDTVLEQIDARLRDEGVSAVVQSLFWATLYKDLKEKCRSVVLTKFVDAGEYREMVEHALLGIAAMSRRVENLVG